MNLWTLSTLLLGSGFHLVVLWAMTHNESVSRSWLVANRSLDALFVTSDDNATAVVLPVQGMGKINVKYLRTRTRDSMRDSRGGHP